MYLSKYIFCIIGATLISTTYAEIKDDSASNALNQFALKLLAETNRQLPEGINLAISPYTIWTAMAIVNEGARGNTAQELEKTLFIPPNGADRESFRKLQQKIIQSITQKSEGVSLEILNSLFTRLEAVLYPEYVKLVNSIYNVQVEPLDFKNGSAAARHINKQVSDATHGRIPEVVNAETVQNAYMLITSSLFFKGQWDKKFEKNKTRPEKFYNERNQPIGTVSMMETSGAFPFSRILNGNAIAVELPYVGNNVSMILVLPVKTSLLSTLHSISQTPITRVVEYLRKNKETFADSEVKVLLPKFKISTSLELGDILSRTGMPSVFNPTEANLSGISSNRVFVSRVLHTTNIEVDEDGTEGSSATTVDVIDKGMESEFIANKPFAFFVLERQTQSLIFMGRVYVPETA